MEWLEACKKSPIGIAERIDFTTDISIMSIYYRYKEGHVVGKKNGIYYYNNIPVGKVEGFMDWKPCYKM